MTLRLAVHLTLHVLIPGAVANLGFKNQWKKPGSSCWRPWQWIWIICWLYPVFDPNRCSIGFHPLHSAAAICCYLVLTIIPKSRIIGAGLHSHGG
ncbi:MAG: DUF6122 family protein [Desulfobacterales bacterium]